MKLLLEEIGPVKRAEIDLDKNLIVLCGANNAGKTYIAYTIYGLQTSIFSSYMRSDPVSDELDLLAFYKNNYPQFYDNICKHLLTTLPDIFATNGDKSFFKNTKIALLPLHLDEVEKRIKGYSYTDFIWNRPKNRKKIGITENEMLPTNTPKLLPQLLTADLINITLGFNPFDNIYIAPAERIAINIFSRELSIQRNALVEDLLENNNPTDLLHRRAKRYSLPIRQSLKIAEDLKVLQTNDSEFAYLADFLEKDILKGKIKVSKEGEIAFNPNKTAKNLDVHLSASMVKSLASIVFYLRHLAQKNDFIIIDEPELNLHPDNQRKIARFLVRLVNAGFKVLISTHSDYIVKEFNNLIMLNKGSKDAQKLMKEFGYHKEELLDPNTLGAHLVKNGICENLEVNETGFSVQNIDEEINALNHSAEKIYYTLYN